MRDVQTFLGFKASWRHGPRLGQMASQSLGRYCSSYVSGSLGLSSYLGTVHSVHALWLSLARSCSYCGDHTTLKVRSGNGISADNLLLDEFQARSPDELSLAKGDRVQLVERDDDFGDGWYLGKHLTNGDTGLFPEGTAHIPVISIWPH